MYGGLFGDLPAAKKSRNDASSHTHSGISDHSPSLCPDTACAPSVLNGEHNQGVAAAYMNFVPTVARGRRRGDVNSKPSTEPLLNPPRATVDVAQTKLSSAPIITTFFKPNLREHDDPSMEIKASSKLAADQFESEESVSPVLCAESEELRNLHEKATEDPYDPMVPNDLLQYWDHKSMSRERERLERERLETMEAQKRLCEQLERERRALTTSGDVAKIADQHIKRSFAGGRGRGLSNLPAWLVEQQKSESSVGE
ncbi:predicted protein [Phaeodactylum tricornutum CCAP 1055/1]|jgi:hypothetical protein|uniref:Uncharacterized protein n=2 Tax=Phaeodactylum tricornutum TaxID=2850 RepID=B7FQN2_PHATC|nr:predicted protein [Phaeodactylum tricornutum CCAP 1055/1]EEC51898.1 predicted protein [Phaeodactylum tricornutum CCAP 1055/1]|eukprot:XP_002177435.1 predicted protein [Phaeodactylum tricornutum CCAP 1055/1]